VALFFDFKDVLKTRAAIEDTVFGQRIEELLRIPLKGGVALLVLPLDGTDRGLTLVLLFHCCHWSSQLPSMLYFPILCLRRGLEPH
jgi:hypothetical protein